MNQAKLVLVIMQHIPIIKIQEKNNISVKILKSKAYEIERNCNYDGYQRALASTVYTIFDKNTGSGISVNEQIADELPKAVIKKILRIKMLNIQYV